MEDVRAVKGNASATQGDIKFGEILRCLGRLFCIAHTILPTPVLTGSGSKGRSATPNLSADLRSAPRR